MDDLVKLAQKTLNVLYNESLVVDGIMGINTLDAINRVPGMMEFPLERQLVGFLQYVCLMNGIPVGINDGYYGPQSQYAFGMLSDKVMGISTKAWRDDEGIRNSKGVRGEWPYQTQKELISFYGQVGTRQTKLDSPYPMKLAWDTDTVINRFSCHELVAPSLGKVLQDVLDHYGLERIRELGLDLWGGCLSIRPLRGGTNYSTHAWGISLDFDPMRNQLRWDHTKAEFAKPVYNDWWEIWESYGWVSLGRVRDYDWMHVQAALIT